MTTLSVFLKVWSIIQFQTEYLYFILSGKLQLDLSPVLWPLGATCECVPSLPSEKSHPPTSERSKLFCLLEALYLIHHCGVWPLSGSDLSVATQTRCVGVPLPFFLFHQCLFKKQVPSVSAHTDMLSETRFMQKRVNWCSFQCSELSLMHLAHILRVKMVPKFGMEK